MVRGVIAASTRVGVDAEVGVGVDEDRRPAGQGDQVPVHDEVGVEDDHLVAGVDHAAEGQQQRPRRAGGDEHLAVGVAELGVDGGLEPAAELGDALGDGVGVPPALDGLDRGGLDRVGHVEVGQADREVDRVVMALARSNTLRMPEASMCRIRSAIQASFTRGLRGRRDGLAQGASSRRIVTRPRRV